MDDRFWNNNGINKRLRETVPRSDHSLISLSHIHVLHSPFTLFCHNTLGHSPSTKRFASQSNSATRGHVPLAIHHPFVLAQVSEPRKKHGNGPKKATNLEWSYREVKGVLGSMENGGIGLRRGPRIVPTSTTCVHRANHPNGHLERRHPQKICYGAERLYYLSRGGSGIKA